MLVHPAICVCLSTQCDLNLPIISVFASFAPPQVYYFSSHCSIRRVALTSEWLKNTYFYVSSRTAPARLHQVSLVLMPDSELSGPSHPTAAQGYSFLACKQIFPEPTAYVGALRFEQFLEGACFRYLACTVLYYIRT
jgi:hypothetical protein